MQKTNRRLGIRKNTSSQSNQEQFSSITLPLKKFPLANSFSSKVASHLSIGSHVTIKVARNDNFSQPVGRNMFIFFFVWEPIRSFGEQVENKGVGSACEGHATKRELDLAYLNQEHFALKLEFDFE